MAEVRAMLARRRDEPGALLPVLHEVQALLGHIPPALLPEIAEALNLSCAEVHGVVSYYHHFRSQPPGRHVLQVCRAESCQACGGEALLAEAVRRLGCAPDSTRADAAVSLESVYCLGLCALSPAVLADGRPLGRMSADKLARLAAGWERGT